MDFGVVVLACAMGYSAGFFAHVWIVGMLGCQEQHFEG